MKFTFGGSLKGARAKTSSAAGRFCGLAGSGSLANRRGLGLSLTSLRSSLRRRKGKATELSNPALRTVAAPLPAGPAMDPAADDDEDADDDGSPDAVMDARRD